jgi:mannitol/fructose-specific phosphotransferase system IIA component (Ntr-type)
MTLGHLLAEDQIVLDLTAHDRWGAIEELADRLFQSGRLPMSDRELVLERLRARELRLTTGVGSGVAIPHALYSGTEEVLAVLGRSTAGLDFESGDKHPVHIIVLFIVPESNYMLRLQILSAIGKTLVNPEVRRQLLEANSAAQIRSLLRGRPGGASGYSTSEVRP